MTVTLFDYIVAISALLIIYHHAFYPALMALAAKKAPRTPAPDIPSNKDADDTWPAFSIVMPAYNEAAYLEAKLRNIAALDYPADKISVLVGCDGCTDDSQDLLARLQQALPALDIQVHATRDNRGKTRTLNNLMAKVRTPLVVLTDVSAMLPAHSLTALAAEFSDPKMGVVGLGYSQDDNALTGEAVYWDIQTRIKAGESRLAGLIGAHGAAYALRRQAWKPLQDGTINDDFIIPVQALLDGWHSRYRPDLCAVEMEVSSDIQDWQRRQRIGAGNLQQMLVLWRGLLPTRPALAFCLASGKGLRVITPALMITALIAAAFGAANSLFCQVMLAGQCAAYTLASLSALPVPGKVGRITKALQYLVLGHLASGLGALRFVTGTRRFSSRPSVISYIPGVIRHGKRIADITGALAAMILTLPLWPVIACAIKLTSPGPVFFRQSRIGMILPDQAVMFDMIKFRTMVQTAEDETGAVWATANDPRITGIGKFLRKTRLDELPQLINVLQGDMSLIGPRPERPSFCGKLNRAIPYYIERTQGIRPGITGLAQIHQGYDTDLDDVKNKILFDHAYAAKLTRLTSWIRADLGIVFGTVKVMILGRGQ